jgi:hypothetical protein
MRPLLSLIVLGSFYVLESGCGNSSGGNEPDGTGDSANGSGAMSSGGSDTGGNETGGAASGGAAGGATSGGATSGGAAGGGDRTGGSGGLGTGGSSAGDWPDWVINCRSFGTECPTAFDPDTHYPAAFCAYATEEELEEYEEKEDCPFYDTATPEQIDDAQDYSGCNGSPDESVTGCYPCSSRAPGSYLCSL